MPDPDTQLEGKAATAVIEDALDRLYASDADLPHRVHERATAARFGHHLEGALSDRLGGDTRWRVDCDYDSLGPDDDPKRVPHLRANLATVARELGWPERMLVRNRTGRVVPDVIVHRRRSGRGAGNLIACEVKRIDASKHEIAVDLVKLAEYQDFIGYEHAFLILLGDSRDACLVHRASAVFAQIPGDVHRLVEKLAIRRWKRGHERTAQRQREIRSGEGAHPAQAVAESLSALNALDAMAMWPGPARSHRRASHRARAPPLGYGPTPCEASAGEVNTRSRKPSRLSPARCGRPVLHGW